MQPEDIPDHLDDAQRLEQIEELESIASDVLRMKRERRPTKPLLIEFCGSPKAGKTSCINSLLIFLKRNGFKVKLMTERASVCPVPSKLDPFFNIWTSTSAIAEMAANLTANEDLDVLIADRGLFDALCWFEWLAANGHLDGEDHLRLKSFLTLDKFRSHLDLVYVFQADPSASMKREYATLLTNKTGSIMQSDVLSSYNEAIDRTRQGYGPKFREIEVLDTTNIAQNEVSARVTKRTLEILRRITEERIGYVRNHDLEHHVAGASTFRLSALNDSLDLEFDRRDELESHASHVQLVPCLMLTNVDHDKVLVVRKRASSTSEGSPESGALLSYVGGHVRAEDQLDQDEKLSTTLKRTLVREVREELGLSISADELGDPLCIWDQTHNSSRRHLCVMYLSDRLDPDKRSLDLDPYELIQKRGKSESGRMLSLEELVDRVGDLDSWSRMALQEELSVEFFGQIALGDP